MMPVSGLMRDLFNRKVTKREKLGCLLQPLLRQNLAERRPGLLFEQPLKMRRAQRHLLRQISNGGRRRGLDHLKHLPETRLVNFSGMNR